MAKNKNKVLTSGVERFNRVSLPTNILFSLVFILLALLTVIPLIFVIIVSFSSAESVRKIGYSFVPLEWSLSAYRYLFDLRQVVGRSFLSINRYHRCRYHHRIVSQLHHGLCTFEKSFARENTLPC